MSLQLSTSDATEEASPPSAEPRIQTWHWYAIAAVVAGILLGAAVYWREPLGATFAPPTYKSGAAQPESVVVLGPNLLSVAADVPLHKRLQIVAATREQLEYPILNVSGFVLARLEPGKDRAESRWDFTSTEVASAYGDWLQARADTEAIKKQMEKTRELVDVRVSFLKQEWERKEKGAAVIPLRDVVAAKADYLQADIQGQKDILEVESNLKKAERTRGLLERQLLQAGVDPEVIRKATDNLVLVVADVPEVKIPLVRVGQPCEARFFGDPDVAHRGRVGRMGTSVAKEKRTLRVTFELPNTTGSLKPGMFAEIGLDVKARDVLVVPSDAVIHAGTSDYVMKEEGPGKYHVVEVKVDEPRRVTHPDGGANCIPVRDGLNPGDRIVGAGAILLKPMMVKALASSSTN